MWATQARIDEDIQNEIQELKTAIRWVGDQLIGVQKQVLSRVRLCSSMDCSPPGSSVHGIFPGKNTGVGCHFLLQGIFPTQGLNPGLLNRRRIPYHLSHVPSKGTNFTGLSDKLGKGIKKGKNICVPI